MSKIAIKGATTGTGVFTLESPATNTDRTLILPDEAGTVLTSAGVPASAMPVGSVIQVVKGTVPTAYDTFSSATLAASSLYVDITPSSASSKIYITAAFNLDTLGANNGFATLFRDGANLSQTGTAYSNLYVNPISIRVLWGASIIYLDSPNSTSSLRYQVYGATNGATIQFRHDIQTPQIIAMEIAG